MNVGDIVQINKDTLVGDSDWCIEVQGKIGVIVQMAKRCRIPAAKVMVLSEIAEFDLDELCTVAHVTCK